MEWRGLASASWVANSSDFAGRRGLSDAMALGEGTSIAGLRVEADQQRNKEIRRRGGCRRSPI